MSDASPTFLLAGKRCFLCSLFRRQILYLTTRCYIRTWLIYLFPQFVHISINLYTSFPFIHIDCSSIFFSQDFQTSTTKLPNLHYTLEVSTTKVTLVNFTLSPGYVCMYMYMYMYVHMYACTCTVYSIMYNTIPNDSLNLTCIVLWLAACNMPTVTFDTMHMCI